MFEVEIRVSIINRICLKRVKDLFVGFFYFPKIIFIPCFLTGYADDRGPLCFSCTQQQTLDSCNTIKLCGRDEVNI